MTKNTAQKLPYQRVDDNVLATLIEEHKQTWGFAWPYDRKYVAELYLEAKEMLGLPASSKARPKEVRQEALTLMRETHHFPEHPAPFGSGSAAA